MKKYLVVRGMRDLIPTYVASRNYILSIIAQTLNSFNYYQVEFPILESYALYSSGIGGEYSNIIRKEIYNFYDRSGNFLCLRPEGTASCVRFFINNMLDLDNFSKFWYVGPMFRYERPQKNRYRQFIQLGVEQFNINSIFDEFELINIVPIIFNKLGNLDQIYLEINFTINGEEKKRFNYISWEILYYQKQFYISNKIQIKKNILSLFDSKNFIDFNFFLPCLVYFLDNISYFSYLTLLILLLLNSVAIKNHEQLVRGLNYYTGIIFEWKIYNIIQQNIAFCSGGRYDLLVSKISNRKIIKTAIGFAFGIDRICSIFSIYQKMKTIDVYFVPTKLYNENVFFFINFFRKKYPYLIFDTNYHNISNTNQHRKLKKTNIKLLFFLRYNIFTSFTRLVKSKKKYKFSMCFIFLFVDDYMFLL